MMDLDKLSTKQEKNKKKKVAANLSKEEKNKKSGTVDYINLPS